MNLPGAILPRTPRTDNERRPPVIRGLKKMGVMNWIRGVFGLRGDGSDAMPSAREMRRLIDRQEICDCIFSYSRAIDRADRALFESVFHPGATEDLGRYNGPALGFIDFALELVLTRTNSTHHLVGNVMIEFLDDDLARVESYCNTHHRHQTVKGVVLNRMMTGRFIDRFERRNGKWAIAHRKLLIDQYVELPVETVDETTLQLITRGRRDREDGLYQTDMSRTTTPP